MREKKEDQGKFQINKKSKFLLFYLAGLFLILVFLFIAWQIKVQSTPEMASPTKLSEVALTGADKYIRTILPEIVSFTAMPQSLQKGMSWPEVGILGQLLIT